MANKVITNSEIKSIVGSHLSFVGTQSDTYCPTYSQVTGGTIVTTVDSNNKLYVDGYSVGAGTSYGETQLVCKVDVKAKYTSLTGISASISPTAITYEGGTATVTTTAYTTVNIVDSDGNTIVSETITGNVTPTGVVDQTWASYAGNTLTVNKNEGTTSRDVVLTLTYNGKSTSITLQQSGNTIADWKLSSRTDCTLTVVPTTMSFTRAGGTTKYTATLNYTANLYKETTEHVIVATSSITSSITVSPTNYDIDSPFSISNTSITVGSNNDETVKSATATVGYHDSYMTTTATTSINVTQTKDTWTDWILSSKTAYSLSVTPSSMSFTKTGGSSSYVTTLAYTANYYKKNGDGGVAATSTTSTANTVTPSGVTVDAPFTITNSKVSVTANTVETAITNKTATVGYKDDYMSSIATASIALAQDADNWGDWIYSSTTSFSIVSNPSSMAFDENGSTKYYTILATYTDNYYKKNVLGNVAITSADAKSNVNVTSAVTATLSSPFTIATGSTSGTVTATANTTTATISKTANFSYVHQSNTATTTMSITQSGKTVATWRPSITINMLGEGESTNTMYSAVVVASYSIVDSQGVTGETGSVTLYISDDEGRNTPVFNTVEVPEDSTFEYGHYTPNTLCRCTASKCAFVGANANAATSLTASNKSVVYTLYGTC